MDDPTRVLPTTEKAAPKRLPLRRAIDDPNEAKPSIDTEDPKRLKARNETAEAK
jgi:hypothetical protein